MRWVTWGVNRWDEWLEAWRQHKWWTLLFLHVKTSLLAEFFFLSECTATRLQKQTRGRSQRRRSAIQKASHVMGGWTPFAVAPLRIFGYLWGIPLLFVTLPPLPLLYSLYIIHLWYSATASLPYTLDTVMCSVYIAYCTHPYILYIIDCILCMLHVCYIRFYWPVGYLQLTQKPKRSSLEASMEEEAPKPKEAPNSYSDIQRWNSATFNDSIRCFFGLRCSSGQSHQQVPAPSISALPFPAISYFTGSTSLMACSYFGVARVDLQVVNSKCFEVIVQWSFWQLSFCIFCTASFSLPLFQNAFEDMSRLSKQTEALDIFAWLWSHHWPWTHPTEGGWRTGYVLYFSQKRGDGRRSSGSCSSANQACNGYQVRTVGKSVIRTELLQWLTPILHLVSPHYCRKTKQE